jgi:hypothetical protein
VGAFDIAGHPSVSIGPVTCHRTKTIIEIDDEPILQVLQPEVPGGPFRLSALLQDVKGNEILRIEENEWRTPTSNWDVEVVGPLITIRRAHRETTLRLRSQPPHAIAIESLDMEYRGNRVICEHGSLRIEAVGGNVLEASDATVSDSQCAISLNRGSMAIGRGGSMQISIVVNPTEPRRPPSVNRSRRAPALPKIGRNALCPCGSGKKYKKCHGQ